MKIISRVLIALNAYCVGFESSKPQDTEGKQHRVWSASSYYEHLAPSQAKNSKKINLDGKDFPIVLHQFCHCTDRNYPPPLELLQGMEEFHLQTPGVWHIVGKIEIQFVELSIRTEKLKFLFLLM